MDTVTITPDMTLFEVTETYPETIPAFVDNGFAHVGDESKRSSHGKLVTLGQATRMKGKDFEAFRSLLVAVVEGSRRSEDITLQMADDDRMFPREGDIKVAGLLPCPVRIPLLEAFETVKNEVVERHGVTVGYKLAAASVGMDVVQKEMARIRTRDDLPHIFLSAGFESFFDRRNLARFKDAGVFVDRSSEAVNADFAGLELKDPDGHFAMIGVVPAVFLVDKQQLGEGEDVPRSWADLLSPRLEKRIALPVGDFDLFNGILLTLWKHFGDHGVRALSRNLMKSLHPSQAAGRFKANRGEVPTVSVIPYFFSRMARMNPQVEVVWPADGAIISPIFMLEQANAPAGTRELADFFLSKEAGEVLSHRGLFPSLHPDVVNELPEPAPWLWLGWDFVREHDLGERIPRMLEIFREGAEV
ncbi:ABC transporter substrate-binding protein [bacterium]|nr:ABC transporter substrate-binding protein [bacterium]MBU1676594.1 ABC transporter substrate-binding protein [bacterium]